MAKTVKYCEKCGKFFETEEKLCPVCGRELQNKKGVPYGGDIQEDDIVAIMPLIGLM